VTRLRKLLIVIGAIGVLGAGGLSQANANDYYPRGNGYRPGGGYAQQSSHFGGANSQYNERVGGRYQAPHYHAPSVHYDRTYHADSYHWTPRRGLHAHGHYDNAPHYTPGYTHW
jgi:hypothetical protein